MPMHYSRSCSPQAQGQCHRKGPGTRPAVPWRWQQRPRSRLPAPPSAACAGQPRGPGGDTQGLLLFAAGSGCGRSRAGRGAVGPALTRHRSVKVGTTAPVRGHAGNAAPAAFSVPALGLLDLRLDGAGGKPSGNCMIPAGMELSRGSGRGLWADWEPGRPLPFGHRASGPADPAHSCNRFPKNLLTGWFFRGIRSGKAWRNLSLAASQSGSGLARRRGGPACCACLVPTVEPWNAAGTPENRAALVWAGQNRAVSGCQAAGNRVCLT